MAFMTFLKVQETSSRSFSKVHQISWKFKKVHDLMNHSFHCAGFLTGVHGLTLISPPLFFGSCKTSCFRDAMNCCHSDSVLRARDQNVSRCQAMQNDRTFHFTWFYHTSSSCNFAFKQRVHVQICLSVFRGHGFMERSVVTLATPSVERMSPRTNSSQRIVETRTIETSWFY